MWPTLYSNKLGYTDRTYVQRSLSERFELAVYARPNEVRKLLRNNADAYQIDTPQEMMRFVAFLDRPLAVLLDELEIPREKPVLTFIEFHGPLPYEPDRYIVRRVVPSVIPQPRGFSIQVQPMMEHIVNVPILVHLDLSPFKN